MTKPERSEAELLALLQGLRRDLHDKPELQAALDPLIERIRKAFCKKESGLC